MPKYTAVMAGVLMFMLAGPVPAVDQDRDRDQLQEQDQERLQDREQIYGSQLMTPEERSEYRNQLRAAKSAKEREQIRKEHHERMRERAKEQGVMLPDEPPERGMGRGMDDMDHMDRDRMGDGMGGGRR